ncbi:uncharacterized protein LOC133288262 [Gastrolobium bilobum]|uniref:uncharacterized protein LOC133288262 n=1 Tax=Gastrolobium bilobum TaxID=150636 RepID=UPI002AB2B893|nr:uncharacterized protein LOC133288262 [Gastrolobium bilobum]
MGESEIPKKDVKVEVKTPFVTESQIETAMLSRIPRFKEQVDSLTFEGVRRLLEKDLGLETYALDVHKRFIKQSLVKLVQIAESSSAQKRKKGMDDIPDPSGVGYNDHRNIIEPKYLDSQFFTAEGFVICDLLEAVSLNKLAELNNDFCDNMVRVFYKNLTFREDILVSEVKGKTIRIKINDWRGLIGCPYAGRKFNGANYKDFEDYHRDTYVRTLLKPNVTRLPKSKFNARLLTLSNRILHYVITKMIVPRARNFSIVFDSDVFAMWAIHEKANANWPFYICSVMLKAAKSETCALPFAMLVNHILMKYGVDLKNENLVKVKKNHLFGKNLLAQMGIKEINGVWTRVEDEEKPAPMEEDQLHDISDADDPAVFADPLHAAPPQDYYYALGNIMDSLSRVHATLKSSFSYMGSELRSIRSRVDSMETQFAARLQRLEDCYSRYA